MNRLIFILISSVLFLNCSQGGSSTSKEAEQEDLDAKARMQGIWMDPESEDVSFRVIGDTIYYSDSVSMPAYFKIIGDSLVLASGTRYAIDRLSEHLFWFKNQNGDLIKLRKSEETENDSLLVRKRPSVMTYTHQVKIDSVVNYNGERYHWYIAINPTKYKVVRHSYNNDGLEVEHVYYDNIMHISVYQGAKRLYSSDFRKQHYNELVPATFLKEAILAKMEYSKADAEGLHFNATLCIPDDASCYLVESVISYEGKMTMNLVEY